MLILPIVRLTQIPFPSVSLLSLFIPPAWTISKVFGLWFVWIIDSEALWMIHGPYGEATGCVCVCVCVCVSVSVCVQNLIQKVRGFSLAEGRGWYSLSPGTLERYAYGSSLCVLSKVRGLELPPRQQGSPWIYAFHPSRSWVLVLIRLISELEFILFKFTSYSLFPRWMVNLIFRAFEKRACIWCFSSFALQCFRFL